MNTLWFSAIAFAFLQKVVFCHPGHDPRQEAFERRAFLGSVEATSLRHCLPRFHESGLYARNIARRAEYIETVREKRGLTTDIKKRDVDEVLSKSHNMTHLGYTPATSSHTLFSGMNSCILSPEVTFGPYYVSGEYIRQNVVEHQDGVDLILDYQVIDVDTCDPVKNVYLDIWHCNSTGVYSGVIAEGNGDKSDSTNIDASFLRGLQATDDDGVAQFESIFPGHYIGRTAHIHVMVHTNTTLYENATIGNDIYASHVGQTYFDQSLIYDIERLEPYKYNKQVLTLNSNDSILLEDSITDDVDPLMEYTLLGNSVNDGVFAWLAFGINTTYSSKIEPAVLYYEDGGVENPNAEQSSSEIPPSSGGYTPTTSSIPGRK